MAFGLGVLRLSPRAFWAMTLREMAAAIRAMLPEAESFDAATMRELMRRYPDL